MADESVHSVDWPPGCKPLSKVRITNRNSAQVVRLTPQGRLDHHGLGVGHVMPPTALGAEMVMPSKSCHDGQSSEPSRRQFLSTASALSLFGSTSAAAQVAGADEPGVPMVTLGKVGRQVSKLGMGTSWSLAPSLVQASLLAGVRYIDTSETYENTNVERILGQVIERLDLRKEVYLVTKTEAYGTDAGESFAKTLTEHLNASLERLRTDYVDAYFLHGVSGKHLGMLRDPSVRAAFEQLKKAGKIRACGFSCHDARLPELLTTAAEVGWVDQVMLKYSFRAQGRPDHPDDLQRALDAATKAQLGLTAMKTQAGAASFPDKIAELQAKGFKKEVAAIKAVWMDQRIHVVVSEMTTRDHLRENTAASRDPLTATEARLLEEHRLRTTHLFCHGCDHLCGPAAQNAPVADILRFLRYETAYDKRATARRLYQALPEAVRDLPETQLVAAERACPHGLPLVQLLGDARRLLS